MYIQDSSSKEIRWSRTKSERLKRTRGTSFEEIIASELVAVKRHPKRENQDIMLFMHKGYIWIAPYVEAKDHVPKQQIHKTF